MFDSTEADAVGFDCLSGTNKEWGLIGLRPEEHPASGIDVALQEHPHQNLKLGCTKPACMKTTYIVSPGVCITPHTWLKTT